MSLINEQSMKLYTASEEWVLRYNKKSMGDVLGDCKLILLDDLSYLKKKPEFTCIQTAFFRFSHLSPHSPIWNSNWLKGEGFKERYKDVVLLYSHWDYYSLKQALGEEDEIEVILFHTTCFGSIELSGSNSEEEVKTSCGTYKFARKDASYTANISGYFEKINADNEEALFTSLLLKTKFSTLKENFKGLKVFQKAQQKVFWFMPFLMSHNLGSSYEGYALFKGTINKAGVHLSCESSVYQFQTPICVQSPPVLILRDVPLKELIRETKDKPKPPVISKSEKEN